MNKFWLVVLSGLILILGVIACGQIMPRLNSLAYQRAPVTPQARQHSPVSYSYQGVIRTGDRWMGSCQGKNWMVFVLSQGPSEVTTLQGDTATGLFPVAHSAPDTFFLCGSMFKIRWDAEQNDWIIKVYQKE